MVISTYLTKRESELLSAMSKTLAEKTESRNNISAYVRKQIKNITDQEILDLQLNIVNTNESDTTTFQITENQMLKLEAFAQRKNTTKARLLRSIILKDI